MDYATSITKPFGIIFGNNLNGKITDFVNHPIFNNVKSMYVNSGCILGVYSPAQSLAYDKKQNPVFAISQYGYGRIAAFAGSNALSSVNIGIREYSHTQLAKNLAMWLLRKDALIPTVATITPTLTPTPTFVPANTEDQKFLNQVIEANLPWLKPKAVTASYDIYQNNEFLSGYKIDKNSVTNERIGSYIETPLHAAAWNAVPYEAKIMGTTEYQGHLVTILYLFFGGNASDVFSMGPKGLSYSENHGIHSCIIYIDNEKKIPLKLMSFASSNPNEDSPIHSWEFNPDYYAIDGGYAPKDFSVYSSEFSEHQEFQIADGYWFFKNGNSWFSDNSTLGKPGEKLHSVDLRDLMVNNSAVLSTPTMNKPTSTPTVTPTPMVSSGNGKNGKINFKADFSGELLVHIQGKILWLEQSGTSTQPRTCWINNDVWNPEWKEKLSDFYTKLNPSLPESDNLIYQLMPMSSYTTTLVQEPKAENNFEAIIWVKTKNGFNGSLRFSWKKK